MTGPGNRCASRAAGPGSNTVGDIDEYSEPDQQQVRRVDRGIQTYER